MIRAFCAVAFAILPFDVHSKQVPEPSDKDATLRIARYDRNDTVELALAYGQRTHLEFAPDERVTMIATGDDAAWDVAPQRNIANHVFIKPIGVSPATNMVIVTDRRTYNLDLKLVPRGRHYADVIWAYPDRARQVAREARIDDALACAVGTLDGRPRPVDNVDYWVGGDAGLAPTRAWDDGRFTYLIYPRGADLPGIFVREPDGREALLQKTVDAQRNLVVIHRLARHLVLRRGDELAACIVNRGYHGPGALADTGTVSEHVTRTIRRARR